MVNVKVIYEKVFYENGCVLRVSYAEPKVMLWFTVSERLKISSGPWGMCST